MKLKLLITLSVLFGYLPMASQTSGCDKTISGQILDSETNQPVPSAVIQVEGLEQYTTSDLDGNFKLEGLCSDKQTLIISCIGYADSTKDHEHDSEFHFYLTQEVTNLDEVTIQAERLKEKGTETISQVTVGKTEIASNPTQSLAAVLAKEQGVTFLSTGTNVQLPVIHGLYGNRILVLNNGLKHGFQNWGTDHAPEIDINAANSITVIKGAAGVRYGPEALGGAIIVEPNPLLLNNPLYGGFGTGYQTNGRGYNANFEVGQGGDYWSYYANGSYARIGDRKSPDYNLTNSGKEEKAFAMGVLYHRDKWDFKVHYSFVDQNLAVLRASFVSSPEAIIRAFGAETPVPTNPFSYDINEPNQTTQHHLAKAEVNWYYSDTGKLTLTGGVQLNKRDEFDVRRNSELPIIDLDLLTYDYQLEWKHPKWHGLDGLVGLQYFSQNNDNNPGTQTTPFIPNYNTDRFSAFAVESLDVGKNTFEAGVRFDFETNDVRGRETNQDIFRDDYSFTNITASLGFVRQLSDNSTFRSNLGTAWRTPNVAELFSFGQEGFRLVYGLLRYTETNDPIPISTNEVIPLDDSDVEPERGYKFINEFQTGKNGNSHKVTAYSHFIQNYIFDRPIGVSGTVRGPTTAFIYNQVDALFLGVDYSWKREWSSQLTGTFGFNYLWSRNTGDDEPLINQPPVSMSYEMQWDQGRFWKFDTSKWSLRPRYIFNQFQAPRTVTVESLVDGSAVITSDSEIFDFTDAPEGYFLVDLSWNFSWKNLNGGISIQNLFNTSYRDYLNELRYFADEPGRNVLFSLNYQIKSSK